MKKEKIIGVPAWVDKERYGVGVQYLEFLSYYGKPRILMPWEEYAEDIDLLFLTGGPDLLTSSYHQHPSYYTGNPCQFRQFFYDERLANYVGKKPIFGVCLGMQALNVHFGGTLEQHMYHETDASSEHDIWTPGGVKIDGKVHSSHHQAVAELGENLIPLAYNNKKKEVVEAFRHSQLPIVGVQFHPERANTRFSEDLLLELLK